MILNRMLRAVLFIIGTLLLYTEGNETDNEKPVATNPSLDDYPNYSDYVDRDYPNLEYNDDREDRSLHTHHDPPNDVNDQQTDSEEFLIKQLKSTIPGTPGVDYALYQSVPDTSFKCDRPGFYGDVEAQCQVFHICQENDRHDSFLCPVGTVFNQISFICDWWFNFNCEDTTNHYHLNNKFHSSTGSKSMKDAMKRMKNFQENKDMQMIMGLAKVHKHFHERRNINNRVSVERSMSPKVKNLFMLRMRNKKLGEISNSITLKNEDDTTTNTSLAEGTNLELKAASSTGYIDITLPDYTTTINSSIDDIYYNASTPKTVNLIEKSNVTENISNYTLNQQSFLNSTSPETTLYENVTMMEFEASTLAELVTTNKNLNTTEISLEEQNYGIKRDVNEFNSHSNLERETEEPLKTTLPQNETSFTNETLTSNPVEKEATTIIYPKQPFKHENNFVIGNDTHISISVTIHSKFGHSKLQWKRLPGIKRIRKISFKNTEESFTPPKYPVNETAYRKRNGGEKPKSRVMWIPVKKNDLHRMLDRKAFLDSRIPAIALVSRKEDVHEMNEFNKAAIEGSEIPSINIRDFPNDGAENKTIRNSSKLLLDTEAEDIDTEQSNITPQTENFETEIFLVEKKDGNLEEFNETGNFSDVGVENHQAAVQKNSSKQSNEVSEHCKTICIKLLRSLNANSSNSLNSTELQEVPSALTLFDYDSPESQNNHEYGRKSLLEISSSEHWTVKYDPGPNCNENTEDGKVLVKGWSVIIDTGSVTKEKTVKKRGCAGNNSKQRFVIKENLFSDGNAGNRGIRFNIKNSTKPFNSALESKFGSNDQRYWLNLVKNWLEQSTNANQRTNKNVHPREKNLNNEQLFGSFPNFRNNGQYSNFDQNYKQNQNRGNYDMRNAHDFPRRHQEGLTDENRNLNLESRNTKQLDRKSKNSMSFKQNGIQTKLKIQNSKTDRYSDLQTERSDWFQATQRANDRTNYERNKRDSFGSYSDDYSETGISDLKDHPEDDWIDSSTDDTDYSANQDNDEWLSKNFRESQNRHRTENTDGDNWSASLWEQSKKDSMTPSGRNRGNSRESFEWNLKNHQRVISRNKNENSNPRTKNWSLDAQEKGQRRKDTIASRGPDMQKRNNKGEPRSRSTKPAVHGKRATPEKGNRSTSKGNTGIGKGNTGTEKGNVGTGKRNTGTGKGNTGTGKGNTGTGKGNTGTGKGNTGTGKGNTGTGKGNTGTGKRNTGTGKGSTNTRKGYDGFIHSTRKGNGNARSDDENSSRKSTEGASSRPKDDSLHTPKDRNRRKSWFSDEEQSWGRDSNSKESRKKDEDWNKSTGDNEGSISKDRSDWNSEENYWNSEDGDDSQDRDWNEQSEDKKFDTASDWSSESDYTPDWSSSSRGGRNKGFVVHNKGSSTQLSHNEPTWGADRSATKSSKEKGRASDRALPRKNTKGRTDSGFNIRGKPSSWNHQSGSDQDYDDETWIADNSRDTGFKKGFNMELDWSTKPDLRQNVKPQNKGNRVRNQNPKGSSSHKGTNTSPWDDKIPLNHKADVNTERTRTSKGSSRTTSKGSMRRSHSPPKDVQNRPKSTWEDNQNPRNSTNNKGDSDPKKIVWSVQISDDGKLGNGWVPITLRPTVKRNNETQNDWKGSSSRNGDWGNKQDSSTDKSWNTKRSSSRDEDWKSSRDSSKNMEVNNKGISLIDEDWGSKEDSSKDSNWNTKGSSSKEEDWENKDFPKDTVWNTEEWNGRLSKDDNFDNEDSEWLDKDIPNMKEWQSEEKGWSDKERFLNEEDWKKEGSSTDNGWNRKSSNKDGSSNSEDWYSNTSSPKSKVWDEKGNEKSKIEISLDPNWHNKDAKSTNLKADVSQISGTISDQKEATATEINPPIIHMTDESFSHLFYIPGYNFRYKRDYQNRDRNLKTRDTLKKSYKIIKSGEILDDASEDNDKFFLAKADIKVEGHLKSHDGNLKSLNHRTFEASIKSHGQNLFINSDTKNAEDNNERKYESKKMDRGRLDISPKESVIREIWSSPFLSSNFSESGWIPITAIKPLNTRNAAKFNPATSNKNIKNLNLKNSSSTTDNIDLDTYHSDNDYLIVKNISVESWSPSTSKTFNILFLNHTEEPAHIIKNTAVEKTKENVENGTEMKVGNKTLRILSFSDVMKQFEKRGNSSQDNLGAQSTSYNAPITIHPKKYSLKLVDPSKETTKNNSNSWRFSTNENGTKQTWVLVRKNETKPLHPKNNNSDESKKIIDGKKLKLYQTVIGNKTMISETNNFTTDSLLLANNETPLRFTNWHNDSDWTPIIRTVGRVVSYNRTLLLDTESKVN